MNMQIDEAQEMLRASAREFLSESCPLKRVREIRTHDGGFSADLWRQMAELGWMGLALPEAAGGSGMGLLDLCLLIEEMGRACLPSPFVEAIAGSGLLLAEAGGQNDVLRKVVAGEAIVVPAFVGSNDDEGFQLLPRVSRQDGRFVVNGTHLFVPHAGAASHLLCVAFSDDADPEIELLLVPASEPGITVTPLQSMRDERPCRVAFADVTVGPEALVASGDDAGLLVDLALQRMDVARCCDNAGALAWVLEDTVNYAKERKQFGQPLGSFQVIQHYCADMHVMMEGIRMSAYHAAWKLNEGLEADRDAAIACAYAHDVIPRYLGIAHQIHGAMGVSHEHDLHLYTTRAFAPGRALAPMSDYLEAVLTL